MINITNCIKKYNENKYNEVIALCGVDLAIEQGESVAIMGVSGSGKSTLLNIIGCLDVMSSGEYILNGVNVSEMNSSMLAETRNEKLGIVLQNNALLNNDTVIENVKLPLLFNRKIKIKNFKTRINEVLNDIGIADLAKRKVRDLSGGQTQRVAIARAVVNEPEIILADEPTSALDSKTADEIMKIFEKLNSQGKTIIIVTHDIKIAERMDRIVRIADGKIV